MPTDTTRAAITVKVADLKIGRALAAEHRALTAYVMARLLLVDADNEHRAYCDLIEAHDKVADLLALAEREA